MSPTGTLTVGEGLVGGALAATPSAIASVAAGAGPPPPSWLVRLLGLRMAAQGLATAWARGRGPQLQRRVLLGGAAVDVTHAASMALVARWRPAYRRSALASAGLAASAAVLGLIAAGRGSDR